jgi:hypothetical protein
VEIFGEAREATDDNTRLNCNLIWDSIIWSNKMEISAWIFINYNYNILPFNSHRQQEDCWIISRNLFM